MCGATRSKRAAPRDALTPSTPCRGTAELDTLVSPIRAKLGANGGDRVMDFFTINSTDLLEQFVGEFNAQSDGALLITARTNVIKMLLPKLTFYFCTTRTGHKPRVSLVVKGYVGALVPPLAGNSCNFLFGSKFDDKPKTRLAFKRAMKKAIERDASLPVDPSVRAFVAVI